MASHRACGLIALVLIGSSALTGIALSAFVATRARAEAATPVVEVHRPAVEKLVASPLAVD
jgi:hypothetical protein